MSAHSKMSVAHLTPCATLLINECSLNNPMARPVRISDSHILAAARDVFLKRGVQATTAEVALRAGVSEGSIFKRWETKAELFRASMLDGEASEPTGLDGEVPDWIIALSPRIGTGDIESQLAGIGKDLLGFYRLIVPLALMAWSEPTARHRLRRDGDVPGPVRGIRALADYFRAEIRLGRLESGETTDAVKGAARGADRAVLAARTMMGALFNYAWLELTFGAERAELEPEDVFVKRFADLLLDGLAPKRRRRASSRKVAHAATRGQAPTVSAAPSRRRRESRRGRDDAIGRGKDKAR